ncbi:glycosyltransferase [Sphingobacterium paludis]|uniref:Poly(Glycerol-phosphate) alpha-glucosyltransferase n=1 Tax=Sphingobacterium paludis TaxID=1476465 RepID=A0A4R7D0I5_9SPHI|nr:glycosyltransferase [Sphingobacterium paludis]TDS13732.1 poly(glycerol-phosphate) alpha-glucosyltransferase [Sphingobacterium paludis]
MKDRIQVSLLTSSVSRNAGGLFDALKDMCLVLRNTIDITIFSYRDEHTDSDIHQWEGIPIKLFDAKNFFQYSAEIKEAILAHNADILHVHGLWRYPHAFISTWKKHTGKPVVVTPHGMLDPYILQNQGRLKRIVGDVLFAKKAFRNSDYFQALSQKEWEDIREYGLKQPITKIPNGINLPAEADAVAPSDGRKSLLFLARLHPKKGVDLLIEAFAKVRETHPDLVRHWVLDIVGWAQENFDEKLKDLVKQYELEGQVIFHGGLFDNEKKRMYRQASGYILPSHGEGLPMTILEAWAYKLPVLMTPMCNLPEGFESKAALQIDTDVHTIANALSTFFAMPIEKRQEIGQRGYQLVSDHFTWESSAKKLQDLYEIIVRSSNKKI